MRASLICAVLVAVSTGAHASDELAEARRLQATLEYDKALALVDAAIARGGAEPARHADLHLLAGELTAGLDRQTDAEDRFARALALQPDLVLVAGTSPKLTTPFDAARARHAALRIHASATRGLVTLIADADPLRLVAGVAVRIVDASGQHAEVVACGALRVAVPPGATAIEIAALDEHGNRVWVGAVSVEVVPPPVRDEPALVGRPLPWAIATAVLAAAGGAFAYRSSSLQSDWNALRREDGAHDYSQLTALESRGKGYAIAADLSFALAAATAITTAVLYLSSPRATVVASPAGLGVMARF